MAAVIAGRAAGRCYTDPVAEQTPCRSIREVTAAETAAEPAAEKTALRTSTSSTSSGSSGSSLDRKPTPASSLSV